MGLSKSNPPTQVKLLVTSQSRSIPWAWLSWLVLGGGTVFLVAIILSGARLIVDPYSPNWLKRAFPALVQSFEAAPQTVDEVQAELRAQNLTAGAAIAWPQRTQPQVWFYPILNDDDGSIQALWVYRVRGEQLQQVDQVAIRPLKESFITTSLVGTASQVASVDSDARISTINLMPGATAERPWLLLEGKRRYGNTVMRYGQVLSYQPGAQRLRQLLKWASGADQPLQWQGDGLNKQLMVDQTVGLRPRLLLYQLVPSDPPQLQEVSLYRSVYDDGLYPSLYDKALQLAQGAVWSHSLQMMQSAKAALAEDWSPGAQQQLNLIRLHAQRTHGQTEQTWSSQQQQIWAYLIDGQWEQSLAILEEHPHLYMATLKRLEQDFVPLWRQVTVHLQVHPQDAAAQIWAALLVSARQSPEVGEEWLTQRTRSQKTLERLGTLGKPEIATAADATLVEAAQTVAGISPTSAGRYLRLMGKANAVAVAGSGWLSSQNLPDPVPGQTWYHIQVQQLQDSSGWGVPSRGITAASFWAESLALRGQLQLFQHNQPVAGLAVHGVKKSGPQLTLLAIGPDVDGASLVTTGDGVQWFSSLVWRSMAEIPSWPGGMGQTMEQSLGLTDIQMAQLSPHLRHARVDLVGDGQLEHLFTIDGDPPPELDLTPGSTLIFSSAGQLLYSHVNRPGLLRGSLPRPQQQPALLLIEQAGHYSLTAL